MTSQIERRAHPRVDFFAQVQVSRDSEVYIMSAENISLGGMFIRGQPSEHPDLQVGTEVEVLIFVASEHGGADVHLRGRVVQLEAGQEGGRPPGFGVQFLDLDEEEHFGLGLLMAQASQSDS